jgi:Fic family protein
MKPGDFRLSPSGRVVRSPQGFWTFIPNPLPPVLSWSAKLISYLSKADRALGELAGLERSLINPHLLVRPFIRREAVLSSRIEGTRTSLRDLFTYEAVQMTLFEIPDDVHEVQNYVKALEYGIDRLEDIPVSLRLIREIHSHLMKDVRGEEWAPGEFRKSPNWIGPPGSTLESAPFVPPLPIEMHKALDQFERYIHSSSEMPPLVRLGLIHYQFEAIHPFLDGNGRIGRLLVSLLLCSWGLLSQPLLYLSAFFESSREAYYDHLLKVSQSGAWEEWLIYFLDGVESQALDAVERIQRLIDLRENYRVRFQSTRATARLLQVIDYLFEKPILTNQHVSKLLDVHYPTAQRYIDQLETEGILHEITGMARNRVYRADEILNTIDEPIE